MCHENNKHTIHPIGMATFKRIILNNLFGFSVQLFDNWVKLCIIIHLTHFIGPFNLTTLFLFDLLLYTDQKRIIC